MNEDVNGSWEWFWKEVSNTKGGKLKSFSRKKDRKGRLAQGKDLCECSGRSILKICII